MPARTLRQREIYDYIKKFIERQGYEPSYQQIARSFHINSKSAIAKHVAALEIQGLLTRRDENGRFSLNVDPSKLPGDICEIPFFEKLTINLSDDEAEILHLPRFLIGDANPDKIYAFRVNSDSMVDEHICKDDIALIEKRSFATDGECVVAFIENKHSTLERYYDFGMEVELRPANSRLNPLRVPAHFVNVKGIFRGLLRATVN